MIMVHNNDSQKWQQAIQVIEAAQKYLPPDELSAFRTLVTFYDNGNFDTRESDGYIQTLKNSTTKNRLLKKVYLPNFIALCEEIFTMRQGTHQTTAPPQFTQPKIEPPSFERPMVETDMPEQQDRVLSTQQQRTSPSFDRMSFGPTAGITGSQEPKIVIPEVTPPGNQPNTVRANTSRKPKRLIPILAGILVLLIAVYFSVKDRDWFKNIFAEKTNTENVEIGKEAGDIEQTAISNEQDDRELTATDEIANTANSSEAATTTTTPSSSANRQTRLTNAPTTAQLNDLLNKIRNSDDTATDRIRSILGNSLRVVGATNISNVQQLITDVSTNGSNYRVTRINTNEDGKVVSITVTK